MACRLCERIKNIRGIDVILIILICVGMYIANHFQMKKYHQEKQEELKKFEQLQRECHFQQNTQACEELKKFQ